MLSTSFFGVLSLLFCWETRGVNGLHNWDSIPDGLLFGPGVGNPNPRTDFCAFVRDESVDLNDALRGRNVSIAVQFGPGFDFFRYDPDKEISSSNPHGMVALMLDNLAFRAGFSWRNHFVAYTANTTDILFGMRTRKWDRMLNWTTSVSGVMVYGDIYPRISSHHCHSIRILICQWTSGYSQLKD